MPATLYQDLIANGVEVHHWQSDLYVPINDLTEAIRARHPEVLAKPDVFRSTGGTLCWDFAFQYDPWWMDVTQREKTASMMLLRMVRDEGFEFPDACAKAAVSYGVSSDRLRQIYDGDHL